MNKNLATTLDINSSLTIVSENKNSNWIILNHGVIHYSDEVFYRDLILISIPTIEYQNPNSWNFEKVLILKVPEFKSIYFKIGDIYDNNGKFISQFYTDNKNNIKVILSDNRNRNNIDGLNILQGSVLDGLINNEYFYFYSYLNKKVIIPSSLLYHWFYYRGLSNKNIQKLLRIETYQNGFIDFSIKSLLVKYDSDKGISEKMIKKIGGLRFTHKSLNQSGYGKLKRSIYNYIKDSITSNYPKEIFYDIPFNCPIYISFKTIEFDNFVYAYKIISNSIKPYNDYNFFIISNNEKIEFEDVNDKGKANNLLTNEIENYHSDSITLNSNQDNIQYIDNTSSPTNNQDNFNVNYFEELDEFDSLLIWEKKEKETQQKKYKKISDNTDELDKVDLSSEENDNSSDTMGISSNIVSIEINKLFDEIVKLLSNQFEIQKNDFEKFQNGYVVFYSIFKCKETNTYYTFIDSGEKYRYALLKDISIYYNEKKFIENLKIIVKTMKKSYRMSWSKIYYNQKLDKIEYKERFEKIKKIYNIESLQPFEHAMKGKTIDDIAQIQYKKIKKRIKDSNK